MRQVVAYQRFLKAVGPKSDRGCLTRGDRQRELQSYFRVPVADPGAGADPGFFLGGGALVSCSTTSTPINHIVYFFCRIPVVLENRRSSRGRGGRTPCTLPLNPPLNRFYKEQSAGVRFSREACKPHTAHVRNSLALLFHPRPRPFV